MKTLTDENMVIVLGGCSVNYTFHGSAADFDRVLRALESGNANWQAQGALLTDLYNSGCISVQ